MDSSQKHNMDPPPYAEHAHFKDIVICWNELFPYITPEKITPKIYEALLVLSKHFLQEYAQAQIAARMNNRTLDYLTQAHNLSSARILWKIVHIFSESLSFTFSC